MIFNHEEILAFGTEHKFKVVYVGLGTSFMGKYLELRYDDNSIEIEKKWTIDETVYIHLDKDVNGFSHILKGTKSKPKEGQNFIKVKVIQRINEKGNREKVLSYPFEQFYIEESKIYKAKLVFQTQVDPSKTVYVLVNIQDGEAVLRDVFIEDISLIEIIQDKEIETNP